ncbi:hypothetical protein Tco_0361735, partial [Tanacetum coccineum]
MVCGLRLALSSFIAAQSLSGSWVELVVSIQSSILNPSLPLFLYTISPLKGGLGLCEFQVGRVIGVMVCGERVWVSWEGTRDSGLELETVGVVVWVLAGKRV